MLGVNGSRNVGKKGEDIHGCVALCLTKIFVRSSSWTCSIDKKIIRFNPSMPENVLSRYIGSGNFLLKIYQK